jgi:hypothetical protein
MVNHMIKLSSSTNFPFLRRLHMNGTLKYLAALYAA